MKCCSSAAWPSTSPTSSRIQDELRHSQDQLQLIADHAPLSIAYCDAEQRYRFVNKACAEQLGLPATEIIGKHVSGVLGQAAYARLVSYIDRVLSGHTVVRLELPLETIGARFVQVVCLILVWMACEVGSRW